MSDTPGASPTPSPAPRRRWLRVALVASLAFNLAFVGLFAGLALRGAPPGLGPPPGLVGFARALPEDHRRGLMRSLRAERDAWMPARAAHAAAAEAVRAAIAAEPFEPEALREALAAQRRALDALAARGEALVVDRVAGMDPEERAAFAAALERRPRPDRPPRR